jgi:hypothetical protein
MVVMITLQSNKRRTHLLGLLFSSPSYYGITQRGPPVGLRSEEHPDGNFTRPKPANTFSQGQASSNVVIDGPTTHNSLLLISS